MPAFAWDGLGSLFYARGRLADAETSLRRALEIRQAANDGGDVLAHSTALLAMVRCARGAPEDGTPLARAAVDLRPKDGQNVAFAEAVLGSCLAAARNFADAEPLLTRAYETLGRQARRGEGFDYTARWLVALYEAWGKPDRAAAISRARER